MQEIIGTENVASAPIQPSFWGWKTAGIVLSWLTFAFFFLSPFGFIAWLALLIYLLYKKTKVVWYVLLSAWIFVPGCNFVRGTTNYIGGSAQLEGMGMPGPEFGNLDRETRMHHTSSGCIVIGYEPFVQIPNNAAARLWTRLFGYQRGAYSGIYPNETEAAQYLTQTAVVPFQHARGQYHVQVGSESLTMDSTLFFIPFGPDIPQPIGWGKVVHLAAQCWILQPQYPDSIHFPKATFLVEDGGDRLIAVYQELGEY